MRRRATVAAWLTHTATVIAALLLPTIQAAVVAHPAIAGVLAIAANTAAALLPGRTPRRDRRSRTRQTDTIPRRPQ